MRWFTADLHLGHANIIEYAHRPFADVERMNAALLERWNEVVAPDDEVYVLGDVAMGDVAETVPKCTALHGRKILVPGNHDRCWPGHKKVSASAAELYKRAVFEIAPPIILLAVEQAPRGSVTLCHFPHRGDSRGHDRYVSQRPPDDGGWLLHGHVHDRWQVNGRQINVGVDVWGYRPVSQDELIALMG